MSVELRGFAKSSELAPLAWQRVAELGENPLVAHVLLDDRWPVIRSKLAQAICEGDNCALWISIPVATELPNDLTAVLLDSPVVTGAGSGTRERIQRMLLARNIDSLESLLAATPASLSGRKRRTIAARQSMVEALLNAAANALLAPDRRTATEQDDAQAGPGPDTAVDAPIIKAARGTEDGSRLDPDAETIIAWSKCNGYTRLRDALPLLGEAPSDVGEAVDRLLDTPLDRWHTGAQPTVEEVIEQFITQNAHHRNVLKFKVGWDDDRPDSSSLQQELGVSRQRVSQIAQRLLTSLQELGRSPESRTLAWRVHDLKTSIGTWAPLSLAEVRNLALPNGDPLAADAIIWLAGPYDFYEDGSAIFLLDAEVLDMSLTEFCDADGLIDREQLTQAVLAQGVRTEFLDQFLNDWGLTWEVNGHLTPVQGNVGDFARAVLAAYGRPMTAEEICDQIDGGYAVQTVANRLAQDKSFVRTDVRKFGLAHWGHEEYSGIAKEIEERIVRGGGAVPVEDLVTGLTSEFSIKENSVRMNLATPHFVVIDGIARLRQPDDRVAVATSITRDGDTYLQGGLLIWHTPIDSDLLRGSGRGFPNGAAAALGVTPGSERAFTGSQGTANISWRSTSTTGASIGSLRNAVAVLLESQGGHESERALLRIRFNIADGTCSFELLDPVPDDPEAGIDFIRRRTGLAIPREGDVLGVLGQAIETPAANVKSTLMRRGDDEVAEALTRTQSSRHLDDIGNRFARALLGEG